MAMHVPKTGYQMMMKDGAKHFSGLEEAVQRNIEACREFAAILRTSFGPQGMNKIVLNHLQKRFITSDTVCIMDNLEVQHPAAKMIVQAGKMMEQECGDGTNLVVQLTAELLRQAGELLKMGLTPNEIIDSYNESLKICLKHVASSPICITLSENSSLQNIIKLAVNTKMSSYANVLSELTFNACKASDISDISDHSIKHFNVDYVRVLKILGGAPVNSFVINGLAFNNTSEGDVKKVSAATHNGVKPRIAVFTVAFDLMHTETKGTVLLNTADELSTFSNNEEKLLNNLVASFKKNDINVVLTCEKVSDHALDFANRNNIMVVRFASKYDLQRVARAANATMLPVMRCPLKEEIGQCEEVYQTEIAGKQVLVFRQEKQRNAYSTIVLRAASESTLDEMERAVDDGVNAYKMHTKSKNYVAGAGATEMALSLKLGSISQSRTDLSQYSIQAYARSLEVVPRILIENAGLSINSLLQKLRAAHETGKSSVFGVDLFKGEINMDRQVYPIENAFTKRRALELATHTANTILSVDQFSTLNTGLWSKNAKLVFLGLDNAGKTTLLQMLKSNRVSQPVPTLHPTSENLSIGNINFTTFDLGGHVVARKIWRDYFPAIDGIVFIVDAADMTRFEEARIELTNILNDEQLVSCPILILGNKIDSPGAASENMLSSALGIDGIRTGKGQSSRKPTDPRPVEIFMCSILRRQGYGNAFRWLSQFI